MFKFKEEEEEESKKQMRAYWTLVISINGESIIFINWVRLHKSTNHMGMQIQQSELVGAITHGPDHRGIIDVFPFHRIYVHQIMEKLKSLK